MQKIEFEVDKEQKLIKAIIDRLPFFSRFDVKKILDKKDVKLNGNRVKDDITLKPHDRVTVYYICQENDADWHTVMYEDDNILIVNKRAGIEVVSENERDLISILRLKYNTIMPVHRIDRNTEGLVVFSLNAKAEKELLNAFKLRNGVIKKYALLVHGKVDISKIKRTVYLKKVEHLSKVWVSEVKTSGYEPAVTEFCILEYKGDNTLLEAKLITGKTHQIRAHIAYYGYPIVGDQKYGHDKYRQLHLTAFYLAFDFKKTSMLSYLNKLNFEIIPTWL